MNKAIVAGSFDPFTNGHLDIVRRAAKIFDEVTVAIGINTNKSRHFDVERMLEAINSVLSRENLNNCKAVYCDIPIATFCKQNDIKYTVRGIRNDTDFHYEDEITKINKLINPELETVYLPSESHISSSMIREFLQYGLPVEDYVPDEIMNVLRG